MSKHTPMMQQFLTAKELHPECLLFFRMGDFYETFFDDAVTASRELDLTLTAREKKSGNPVPMAGVPHHAAAGYIRRLVEKGYHVAICDQLESPKNAKGIVRRGVTRVITPGVTLDAESLDAKQNNYLATLAVSKPKSADIIALVLTDVSTGEVRVCEVASMADLTVELLRAKPAEIVLGEPHAAVLRPLVEGLQIHITERPERALSMARVVESAQRRTLDVAESGQTLVTLSSAEVEQRFRSLDAHQLRDRTAVESALALMFDYVMATQGGVPRSIDEPQLYRTKDFLVLDPASAANLEIFETLMGGRKRGSLFNVIDRTVTSAGGRRLRTWLAYPLTSPGAIMYRQNAVTELVRHLETRERLRAVLGDCHDIQRISAKLTAGQGNARDLVTLGATLRRIPELHRLLDLLNDPALASVRKSLDACEDLSAMVDAAIVDDPPMALTDGGLIRKGYSAELDELIVLTTNAKAWLLAFEAEERSKTGITSLKVKHNNVFGYYIEVTKANLELVPEDRYVRKQTLVNAERYYTAELKEKEEAILSASDRRSDVEYALFEEVRSAVIAELARLRGTAEQLAELDALAGLAELAHRNQYTAPEVVDEVGIDIRGGRHPVVETMVEGGRFVPNDVLTQPDRRMLIITGPNMAGKSTVIRQVALIALLAQIGAHVPATSARIGVVDQIFSRVGASDNLARGQSTFMVEMTETAHILTNATDRSLVILDEIGRGTSTYDGLSIAWAVAEFLHDNAQSQTLFATHYHELTELARVQPSIVNMNIAAKEWNDDIIFLHTLVDGPANRSYGIQVARLAGVPADVVARAREVLGMLEQAGYEDDEPALAKSTKQNGPRVRKTPQLNLFSAEANADPTSQSLPRVVRELAEMSLDSLTPIEALNVLYAMKKQAEKLAK